MVYGAIDLHMRYSQIRIVDADGRVVREQRVVTSARAADAAFAGCGPMRILLETGTESEWVAQALEAAGHEVIVADPNYAPMYGELRRRVKTDRRDVAALAEANRRGWYRAGASRSAAQRAMRQMLRTRRQLVQMRTGTDCAAARAAAARGLSAAVGQQRAGAARGWRGWRCPAALADDARAAAPDGRRTLTTEIARARCAAADAGRERSDRAAAAECAGRRAGGRADVPGVRR